MTDVAKLAGVSVATVSRAAAGSSAVTPKAKAKVLRAMRELGYTPNALARSLRRQETRSIIVVVPDISNAFFSVLLRGIEEQAHESGYSVLIGNAANDAEREARYADEVMSKRADGLILINGRLPMFNHHDMKHLPPIVVVSAQIADVQLPTVRIDDIGAARTAVEHLLSLGHRRIGYLGGPARHVHTIDRYQGYCNALTAAGVPIVPELSVFGDFSTNSGIAATERLLDLSDRPTAVFAISDEVAIGAILAAKARGLKVPADFSVAGFDDSPFAATYDPPLTTIHQPFPALGRAAMKLLVDRLQDRNPVGYQVILPTHLVIRGSTSARPD